MTPTPDTPAYGIILAVLISLPVWVVAIWLAVIGDRNTIVVGVIALVVIVAAMARRPPSAAEVAYRNRGRV